jgi:hypothetical protein
LFSNILTLPDSCMAVLQGDAKCAGVHRTGLAKRPLATHLRKDRSSRYRRGLP